MIGLNAISGNVSRKGRIRSIQVKGEEWESIEDYNRLLFYSPDESLVLKADKFRYGTNWINWQTSTEIAFLKQIAVAHRDWFTYPTLVGMLGGVPFHITRKIYPKASAYLTEREIGRFISQIQDNYRYITDLELPDHNIGFDLKAEKPVCYDFASREFFLANFEKITGRSY